MEGQNKDTQGQSLLELWVKTFVDLPKAVMANEITLNEYISKFGIAFGKVKAEIVKHELAGMSNAAQGMRKELEDMEKKFDERIYEYLGYPRLEKNIKQTFRQKAKETYKYFNVYYYKQYPRMIPPVVVRAITEARKYFSDSEIEIWAIENEPMIKDPVVVGKKYKMGNELADNEGFIYYLIAIWDNDIKIEDIVPKDFLDKRENLQKQKKSSPLQRAGRD
jgi:hypothetical protein